MPAECKRRLPGKHVQLTRSHQDNLATNADLNPAVGASCRDADPGWSIDETALTQLGVLVVAEPAVSMEVGGNATCCAARCRILDDAVVVPVPAL
jgi:hypothetical protein